MKLHAADFVGESFYQDKLATVVAELTAPFAGGRLMNPIHVPERHNVEARPPHLDPHRVTRVVALPVRREAQPVVRAGVALGALQGDLLREGPRVAVVMGSEQYGLSEFWLKHATVPVVNMLSPSQAMNTSFDPLATHRPFWGQPTCSEIAA